MEPQWNWSLHYLFLDLDLLNQVQGEYQNNKWTNKNPESDKEEKMEHTRDRIIKIDNELTRKRAACLRAIGNDLSNRSYCESLNLKT
jgi:hypothetical protein